MARPTWRVRTRRLQSGMAPNAQLASGADRHQLASRRFQTISASTTAFYLDFNRHFHSLAPIRAAFITGVPTNTGSRPEDVVNSSWVGLRDHRITGSDKSQRHARCTHLRESHTLFTVAAGNTVPSGVGPDRVPSPAMPTTT